ncbi:hydroxylamine reductase [Spirochaetia bacterium]|nr:hydroxylamine reductase [Spirochaetia bacterium]
MFCFQCEQTAQGTACTKGGVCGKKDTTAGLQDKFTGALVMLAKVSNRHPPTENSRRIIREGLFITGTNVNFDDAVIERRIDEAHKERIALFAASAVCDDFDMNKVWEANEDSRSLKSLILFGIRGIAAYACHAAALGFTNAEMDGFFCKALEAVANMEISMDELLTLTMETGKVNLLCMELLDKANTETYGKPTPVTVPLTIEKGPFIVISGHDLRDLKLLLEQSKGWGVNIYTHGEMLPAHGYPALKAYPHLKGNFGTAWQNQQKEFGGIPGAILFTTNCLMPPTRFYRDRVFTTAEVGFPGLVHIDEKKDFTAVINKALELEGYKADTVMTGINGGKTVTTGYAHGVVLENADTIIEAVKAGVIKHFFLVGGCDGAEPGRNYYTDFVKATPKDTVVLTLACGKYRFNDLDIGSIGPFPRIMDMGQCNDAYSAVKVALALVDAFKCGVNELPLSLVLSWYEQKAVAILLTLLHLGIKNIRLGPSLPAFVSRNVLKYLVEHFNIRPSTTAERDLAAIFGK